MVFLPSWGREPGTFYCFGDWMHCSGVEGCGSGDMHALKSGIKTHFSRYYDANWMPSDPSNVWVQLMMF